MNEHPKMVIELGSHTDCRGSAKSNETLSDKRAKESAAYVISKGISKDRIFGKGYGEFKLVNDCECEGPLKSECSELEHQQNRRTEFVIVKMD
jgi:outer membrane protein OmpA-like peptidoglycan-associated protein